MSYNLRLNRLLSAGKQGGPQPVRDPDKSKKGPDRTNTVREPTGSGEPVFPRRFPSRTIELTKQALYDLRCSACHQRGHESADCPWRARPTCIFCGSSSHTRGVECDQPAVYSRYVYSGTAHNFQKLMLSERRRVVVPTCGMHFFKCFFKRPDSRQFPATRFQRQI